MSPQTTELSEQTVHGSRAHALRLTTKPQAAASQSCMQSSSAQGCEEQAKEGQTKLSAWESYYDSNDNSAPEQTPVREGVGVTTRPEQQVHQTEVLLLLKVCSQQFPRQLLAGCQHHVRCGGLQQARCYAQCLVLYIECAHRKWCLVGGSQVTVEHRVENFAWVCSLDQDGEPLR